MTPFAERIARRILDVDNFENVAHVCCDWEEFTQEVAEWGVDHIACIDFDENLGHLQTNLSNTRISLEETCSASF